MTRTADASRPMPTRLAALDLMRIFAALSVLFFHYGNRGALGARYLKQGGYPELAHVAVYGYLGVDLFFLISGFVILLTVEAGKGRPSHFIASRVSRLYPVFWVAATLTSLVMIAQPAPLAVSLRDYLCSLTMVPSRLHASPVDMAYWTLEVELQFYVIVTLYLVFLQRLFSIDTMLALWLAATLCLLPFPGRYPHIELLLLVPFATFFIAGGVFYRAGRYGMTPWRGLMVVVCWLCAMETVYRLFAADSWKSTSGEIVWVSMLIDTVFFIAIGFLSMHPDWLGKYAVGAAYLGALTYPLYLVHQKIGYVLINATTPLLGRWLALLLAIAVVLTIARVLHRRVEVPWNGRFRRWLEPRLRFADRLLAPAEPQRRAVSE